MKEIKKILDFIFYLSYRRESKREIGTPLLLGIINISFIIDLFVFILIALLEVLTKKNIMEQISDIQTFLLATFDSFISYLLYGYKKKYLGIVQELSTYKEHEIKKYKIKIFILIGILLMLLTILLIIKINQNNGK